MNKYVKRYLIDAMSGDFALKLRIQNSEFRIVKAKQGAILKRGR